MAVVFIAIGSHRYRRSRQRQIRTAPQIIHQPPPSSSGAVMYAPPPPDQLPPSNSYPNSYNMEHPPPYSANPDGDVSL